MKRTILCTLLAAALVLLNGGGPKRLIARPVPAGARIYTSAAAAAPPYTLTAWSELGMHCDDGKDYSIFSVLPPYNVIHSQLIKKGEPPVPITTGVTVSYIATADTQDSINTTSANKTNFWTYVQALLHTNPPRNTGIAGYKVQSLVPQPMTYNAKLGYWEAVGWLSLPANFATRIVSATSRRSTPAAIGV